MVRTRPTAEEEKKSFPDTNPLLKAMKASAEMRGFLKTDPQNDSLWGKANLDLSQEKAFDQTEEQKSFLISPSKMRQDIFATRGYTQLDVNPGSSRGDTGRGSQRRTALPEREDPISARSWRQRENFKAHHKKTRQFIAPPALQKKQYCDYHPHREAEYYSDITRKFFCKLAANEYRQQDPVDIKQVQKEIGEQLQRLSDKFEDRKAAVCGKVMHQKAQIDRMF